MANKQPKTSLMLCESSFVKKQQKSYGGISIEKRLFYGS